MSSVQLTDVVKQFGTVTAVDRLNLSIENGEFFTLLGPSGCGKTTTLRMVAGFYYPTAGRVFFNARDMTLVPPNKRNTGMVFQNYALFPHMTVFENVAFGLKVRNVSKHELKRRVYEALEMVRLSAYGARRIGQLSGGQQQRVALARALVIRPDILLLDEPLSNLDARLRDEMRGEIQSLQRELGITTIYVTHDQVEALTMSDRMAVFNEGVCQQIGTPSDIYNYPRNAFIARFVGETSLLPCTITDVSADRVTVRTDSGHTLIVLRSGETIGDVDLQPGNDNVSLSIRPEAVELAFRNGEGTIELTNKSVDEERPKGLANESVGRGLANDANGGTVSEHVVRGNSRYRNTSNANTSNDNTSYGHPSLANTVQGRVKRVQFTGSAVNCIVELDGGASLRAMMLNCRHSVAQVKEGDTTWFQIPSTGLRLIPNS